MEEIYKPQKIEKYVQNFYKKNKTFLTKKNKNKKKYYCLCMLPYPSGFLHMGHVRNYTLGDIISRYQRLLKKNVLHPIGWDSFGLPAENAAIKNNLSPFIWTKKNIKQMKKQLKKLGISYDWEKEINTSNPIYYKWEQWLFIKLLKKKLIYKKKEIVNWCKNDKTVLANEQVIKGKCWRCNSYIEKKYISQWFIKITKYAEQLLNDIKKLKDWPEKVKNMQKKWIGKSKGIEIILKIPQLKSEIKIYTHKKIFILTSSAISISIYHKIFNLMKKKKYRYIKKIEKKIIFYKNKNIFDIGFYSYFFAINPLNNKILTIWITNFTEEIYNTKAIFINKKYNEKHKNFIKKYNLYINKIKKLNINKKLFLKKKLIFNKTNYKLKDWVISRQRFWGVPIPIINRKKKIIPVKLNKLPVILPNKKNYNISLKKNKKWKTIFIKNKKYIRETDTFDTFLESSWYYIRYISPKNKKNIFDIKEANYWLPIDIYIGGIEHATMHLIYLRFINKIIRDLGLIKYSEPVKKLLCQGMILSKTFFYIKKKKKIWVNIKNVKEKIIKNKKYFFTNDKNKKKLYYGGIKKMSKSKNNGINPIELINKYGADSLRLFIIFSAPIENNLEWNEFGIIGCYKFLNRLWSLVFNLKKNKLYKIKSEKNYKEKENIKYFLYKTINEVTKDISVKYSFNTAISTIMKFINILKKFILYSYNDYLIKKRCINIIIILLYPFTPHICFYLWNKMGNKNTIEKASWPKVKKKYLNKERKIIIGIQINGKIKKKIYIKNTLSKLEIEKKIYKKKFLNSFLKNKKKIKKIFYIKNKIINFII